MLEQDLGGFQTVSHNGSRVTARFTMYITTLCIGREYSNEQICVELCDGSLLSAFYVYIS